MNTRIATADATTITVKGRDLVNELVGKLTFTEMTYLLVCGREPTPADTRVLDACLVTLAEHGLNPSTLVARLLADSVPDQVQVAVGAGLMAVGDVFAGTMENCARVLQAGAESADPIAYCAEAAANYRHAGLPMPGFGHRTHSPDDPRTPRLLEIAAAVGHDGRYVALLRELGRAVDAVAGRHVTINATGAIAALFLEIGIPIQVMRCLAVVSRAGGLAGHVLEEQQNGSARAIWEAADQAVPYKG